MATTRREFNKESIKFSDSDFEQIKLYSKQTKESLDLIKRVLVGGERPIDVAETSGMSRQNLHQQLEKFFKAFERKLYAEEANPYTELMFESIAKRLVLDDVDRKILKASVVNAYAAPRIAELYADGDVQLVKGVIAFYKSSFPGALNTVKNSEDQKVRMEVDLIRPEGSLYKVYSAHAFEKASKKISLSEEYLYLIKRVLVDRIAVKEAQAETEAKYPGWVKQLSMVRQNITRFINYDVNEAQVKEEAMRRNGYQMSSDAFDTAMAKYAARARQDLKEIARKNIVEGLNITTISEQMKVDYKYVVSCLRLTRDFMLKNLDKYPDNVLIEVKNYMSSVCRMDRREVGKEIETGMEIS